MDSNVGAALDWSNELGGVILLKSLEDKDIRANFINDFDKNSGGKIFENYHKPQDKKKEFIKEIAELAKKYVVDISGNNSEIAGLTLGLWGACTITSKQIDIRRKEITPEVRKERFVNFLDPILGINSTFRLGMEVATNYCKLRGEKYSLEGVPSNSPVRQ